jgi:LPS sulfotransferase NodH
MIRRPLVLPDMMRRIHGPNRDEIANAISIAPGVPADLPPALRYVFTCFTNRCGSAYLGDILQSTGCFAQAAEPFNAGNALPWCRQHDVRSFRHYFEQIVRRDASNGSYIVKVVPEQIVLLTESGILDQIVEQSDFLFLHRVDKLAQAISRTVSEQNNRWAWDSPIGLPDDQLVYSSERIAQHLRDITLLNLSFEQFFGLNGIMPITVEYERLVGAPQQELDEIARRLGRPGLNMDPTRLRYRRQANEVNRAWRSRFLQEASAPSFASFGTTATGTTPTSTTAAGTTATGTTATRPDDITDVVRPVTADIVAHVHNVGDVTAGCDAWVGVPGRRLWIEGFSITPRQGIAVEDIEYQGITDFERPTQWVSGGTFCGTRGLSTPLRGVSVRLRHAAADRYQCTYSARFLDGTTTGPLTEGRLGHSAGLAPLETFLLRIEHRPRRD